MRIRLLAFASIFLLTTQVSAQQPQAMRNDVANRMSQIMKETFGKGLMSGKDLDRAIAQAEKNPLGSKKNPVRVDGPPGEHAYLERLQCSDGSAPKIGMRNNVGEGPFDSILDAYPLTCGTDTRPSEIYMDMYFRGMEDRPPPGFSIKPLPSRETPPTDKATT